MTFNATQRTKTFTLTAVDDDIDDDGEKVKLGFGTLPSRVTSSGAGIVSAAAVSIMDNDTRGITITPTSLSMVELAFKKYTVVLDSEPTGTVTVTNVNERPELLGTPVASAMKDENTSATVAMADYDARDEEGLVTWSLTGTDRADFTISTDGIVTINAVPNFEDPVDSNDDNVYTFTVVATDVMSGSSRLTATTDVTVTVADVEEAGVITVNNANPGAGDDLRFTLTDPDGDIKTGTTSANGLAWRIQGRTGDRNVGSPRPASDRDNDTLTFGIATGENAEFFEINASTGQLRLAKAVDYETATALGDTRVLFLHHHTARRQGADADNNVINETTVDAESVVTVEVIDVEEPGVVTLSAAGTLLQATLEDGDGSVSGQVWEWARSEDGRTGWFNIAGETSSSYTPSDDDEDLSAGEGRVHG